MIKKFKLLFSILVSILFVLPMINAAFDFDYAKEQATRVIDAALGLSSPFLEKIIGDYNDSEFFFGKVLVLILLILIIKNILDRTPIGEDNKKISFLVALIVSILAVRFMNQNNFFEAILIQYGVLGIAITTILPMVIFFYFIHNTKVGTYGRKLFWAIYAITLGAIWISKSAEIPEVANWIYTLSFLAAIIFIFFDKSIHSYFGITDFKRFEKKQNREAILRAKERIAKLNERLDKGIINRYEYGHGIREEEKLIKELSKE